MMNIKQNNKLLQAQRGFFSGKLATGLFLMLLQAGVTWADGRTIKALDFATLAGDKVQLQLEMDGPAVEPKVFQTDNPARIALDFSNVKSGLAKKSFSVNKGAASNVYVVEVAGRTRVVINLAQTVPYETSVAGNKVLVTLNETTPTAVDNKKQSVKVEAVPDSELESVTEKVEPAKAKKQSVVARLLPKQAVKDIDFRRGSAGNGLLLIALAKPNTVVDVKEKGGKVVLKFLNTQLPVGFRKRFDVSDFATPVQKVDAVSVGSDTVVTVTTADGNYEYSSYQANGLLTVDFKPLSPEEKEAAAKKKFPYSGNKLSLNFQDISIRSVLQILADFTEFNMIASDTVGGNVTLRLNDVPWDQALDLILKSKGLGQRKAGNVVWIAPTAEITKLERDEEESQKVSLRLEPLRTEYIQINYAKAEEIVGMLVGKSVTIASSSAATTAAKGSSESTRASSSAETETASLLSSRGSASFDARTNTLIVKDIAGKMDEISGLVKLLDVPVRQVMIESRIVIANKSFSQNLGVKFGVGKAADVGQNKNFSFSGTGVGKASTNSPAGIDLANIATTAIGAFPPGALAMTLSRTADYVLNLELQALEAEGKGEVVSNPRVMTSDRVSATIKQGVQIPYPTTSNNGTQTTFKDAVLQLQVTPQITPDGSVIMKVDITNNSPNFETNPPGIDTRQVTTEVQVSDGETVVLGGVYEFNTGKSKNKIPFFGDLPGIGFLFTNTTDTDSKKELLVFLTPKIVKAALAAK